MLNCYGYSVSGNVECSGVAKLEGPWFNSNYGPSVASAPRAETGSPKC